MAIGSRFERVDFETFAPDLRPDSPSMLIDMNNVYPTAKGFRTLPALQEAMPALATGFCKGGYYAQFLDGSSRVFAGTDTKLYEANSSTKTWGDVTRTTGGDYNVATNHRWRFAQFGDNTIAVNGNNDPQYITRAGTNFAQLAGTPPIAHYVGTANGFVMMANIKPSSGVDEVTWWCSALNNDSNWTPSPSSQSANSRLLDTPGPITGLHPLGRNFVIYKQRATYLMEFTGPPLIWRPNLLSQSAGAFGNEAVVNAGGIHYFMGFDDFYMYDGSGPPRALQSPLREFIFERGDLDKDHGYAIASRWDRETNVIFWYYPSSAGNVDNDDEVTLDRWVAWSVGSSRWTYGKCNVAAVMTPEYGDQPGITYDEYANLYSTWGAADTVSWTSAQFAGGASIQQATFDATDDKLYAHTGAAEADCYVRGGWWGDGIHDRTVRQIRPIFSIAPNAAASTEVMVYVKEILGGAERLADSRDWNENTGWFDIQTDGKYTSPKIELNADLELIGYDLEYEEETGEA